MENKNLYGWIFTFNPYEDKWYATQRDNYNDLWNDRNENEKILSSKDITTLMVLINKTNGNKSKISKLVK